LILSTIEDVHLNDIGNGYIRSFRENGASFIDYEVLYAQCGQRCAQESILRQVKEGRFDVVLYMAGPADFHFELGFFKKLKERAFTVMMLGDSEHYFERRDIYYGQCMDMVIVYGCLSRYRFIDYGVNAISFYSSYDNMKYVRRPGIIRDIDISFIGGMDAKTGRQDYLNCIINHGHNVLVYGRGSPQGEVSLERMVDIFNRTKINMNFSALSSKNFLEREPNIKQMMRQMKGRMAEVALCGGFVLTEYVPGMEEVFEIDQEIATFRTSEEMLEKIEYYLQYESAREAVAENGYRRASRDYALNQAVPQLISRINDFRGKKRDGWVPIYSDSSFLKHYTSFRFSMIAKFFSQRNWRGIWEELQIVIACRKFNPLLALKYFLQNSWLSHPLKKLRGGKLS